MDMLRINEFYSSGEYTTIVNAFRNANFSEEHRPFGAAIMEFGTHRDDNFQYGDIEFLLTVLSDANCLFAEGTLGGVGSFVRGWHSSTFNRFVLLFLHEIREIICDKKKAQRVSKGSDVTAGSVVTGLAAWISTKFGLADPVSVGVATAVLLSVIYATKGAFCKMTNEEVKDAMNKRIPR
jgi:hypothetical protein